MIATHDFKLDIEFLGRQCEKPGGPYLDWIDVRITVEEPGVTAAGTWRAMPSELARFRDELAAMRDQLRPTMVAELRGAEPNFVLTLRALHSGAILGEWRFQPAPPDGAIVTGRCGIDESFLDGMIATVDALLSQPPVSDGGH